MKVENDVVLALRQAVSQLKSVEARPIPIGALAALVPLARPGTKLGIDIEASAQIGAPLITISAMPGPKAPFAPLTKRQKQVAELMSDGLSNQDIADALGITLATVKDHVHAILQSLKLPSRAAVIATALSLDAG